VDQRLVSYYQLVNLLVRSGTVRELSFRNPVVTNFGSYAVDPQQIDLRREQDIPASQRPPGRPVRE